MMGQIAPQPPVEPSSLPTRFAAGRPEDDGRAPPPGKKKSFVSYANEYVEKLAELDRRGTPFVSVTLIETIGSAPQERGTKMLVDAHGLAFGTVGGGRVELKALDVAQQLLAHSGPGLTSLFVEWNLQRDVGMTCGGVVKLYFETFNRRNWHIVVFGAGHVAQALVRTLLTLDCQVTCVDSRAEWLARLPQSPKLATKQLDEPAEEVPGLSDDDYVICMTMGHRTDRPIMRRIFELGREFPFLGVIGSRAKRKVLVRELKEEGIAAELAECFECPVGLPLGNNQPNEIAISIAAQLIQRRDERARQIGERRERQADATQPPAQPQNQAAPEHNRPPSAPQSHEV